MPKKPDTRTLRKSISLRREENILAESAKTAALNANRSSRALGLTVKIIKGGDIITIRPDRTETVVRSISRSSVDISKLRKGSILRKK